MIINREVEISTKISDYGNNIPDLMVECQTSESNCASIIIEVKGCWNTKALCTLSTSAVTDEPSPMDAIKLVIFYS